MRVQPLSNCYCQNFSSKNNNNSQKQNFNKKTLIATSAVAIGSALILACLNKTKILQQTQNISAFCKDDLFKLCKEVNIENYRAKQTNIDKGIFRIDLHSHTNNSDGWGKTSDILNQVAEYADKVYKKTGKKFTFAITDHDNVNGIREANLLIKNNPEKFKHVNFIQGVELSFSFNSNGQIKNGELLAYFVNPDSKSMKLLVDNLRQNRLNMIDNCIKGLGVGFSRSDMNKYFLNEDGETFAYNLHYRLRNYAQIKNRINKIAIEKNEDSSKLYKKLMDGYVFGEKRVGKPYVSPEGFDEYLKRNKILTKTSMIDDNIEKHCKEFYPKILDNKIVSKTENSFEKIIDTLREDKDVVLGFAHPYFTAKQMQNYKVEFEKLLEYANGRIELSENYHQAYNPNINVTEIDEINKYLLGKNLIPIGGRDNHKSQFL